jgi:uncharacterized membrane protein
MAYYAPANSTDVGGFYELFRYVNTVSGGNFALLAILLPIWVITFIAVKQYSTSRAWTSASFICMVLGMILSVLGLISSKFAYLMIIFTAVGALWIKLEAKG